MGYEIYKEAPDVDYYIVWCSQTDGPVFGGNRAELIPYLFELDDRKPERIHEFESSHPENRAKRADETGTSAMWRAPGYPLNGSWEDTGTTYRDEHIQGGITRRNMFVLVHRLDENENADLTDLVEPFEDEAEVRA